VTSASITSADNKLFKLWHSLLTSKGIDKHGVAIVSGRRIVPELAREAGEAATILLREGNRVPPSLWEGVWGRDGNNAPPTLQIPHPSPPPEGEGITGACGARTAHLAPALFDALDEFGTHTPLLIIPTPPLSTFDPASAPTGLALALAAQDPANLGAILRSAHAFGAAQIILLQECSHPFLPKVTRSAAGANFRLPLARGPSINAVTSGFIALDMAGEPIDEFAFPRDCRLLFGEEGAGIPPSFKGRRVSIPIAPGADSLNVAVAAGIALAAYRRQHPL
jgi:tRNA(Leu) C34 or U34 (ribose-2'-O)-methylase TrmL